MRCNHHSFKSNFLAKIAGLLLLGALQACVQQPVEPAPETPEPVEAAPLISEAELRAWLHEAEIALSNEHFTYPEEGSALSIYRRILKLDPEVEAAQRGVERIVEHFVDASMQALERRQFATARSMLARARLIKPDHPSIEPSAEQIRLIMSADRAVLKLNRAELAAETPSLKRALAAFALEDPGCRYTIYARNDGQGRWIYQHMSKPDLKHRLRAQIKIRQPTQIERLCFDAAG